MTIRGSLSAHSSLGHIENMVVPEAQVLGTYDCVIEFPVDQFFEELILEDEPPRNDPLGDIEVKYLYIRFVKNN